MRARGRVLSRPHTTRVADAGALRRYITWLTLTLRRYITLMEILLITYEPS